MKNIKGERFGKLLVGNFAEIKNGGAAWNCICDCGNSCVVVCAELRRGHTKSCGCLQKEVVKEEKDKFREQLIAAMR